jgi:peptide/nickel transport system substrate-binding protein
MATKAPTRRRVLQTTASAAGALAAGPFVRRAAAASAATKAVPRGKMTLAWHTNIAARWLDPTQHDGSATPDNFLNALHDALIKNYKTELYNHLALADEFEFGADAKSAVFRLRQNIHFHNGWPVTPEDIQWSYAHYRGAWAAVLHSRTDRIKILDKRTIRFEFKEPFLDFPRLMGTSNVCGAAWVVPAKYYQKVGQAGFVQKPIGAGPYRLVSQEPGTRLDFEAFDGYYAPVHIKHLTMLSVPEPATRVAMMDRGDADLMYFITGDLLPGVMKDKKIALAPVVSANWWVEFPGFENPKNPFHDRRVREAVSLAIDRNAMNQVECAGLGVVDGNWINDDVEYALPWPKWPHDVAKARRLMAEAGYPNGFTYDWLTPAPPYYSRGERIMADLQQIGIRGEMQSLERGVYNARRQAGLKAWPGINIILAGARIGASWANWYESLFRCGGRLGADAICVHDLDAKFARYIKSDNAKERQQLASEVQRSILENYYFIPVFRQAFVNGIGNRIAATTWHDVFPTITTGYAYPWEEIRLKVSA